MAKALRILMLEDLQDDVGLIERTLSKQGLTFVSKRVDSKDEFTEALSNFDPDVILSDHALPQFNSLEALSICQRQGIDIPFILVTGTVSEEFAVSCLKQGADDYVLKSNMVRLPSAIRSALRQRHHETKRRKAEKILRKQNDQLVKINKELDSFVYSVSHNLRAPLMSVLGLINLVQIEYKKGDEAMDPYFKMMQASIHKLDETLKEILDYSRNSRSEVNVERVGLQQLFEDAFERLHYVEGSGSINKTVLVQGTPEFFSDPYRISVVIHNLISNAIKYRDVTRNFNIIDIRATVTETEASIVFRDNGIGISSEFLPRIFDMFYRATERSEGAGLGLYIVKETIDKLGGTIRVESDTTQGTNFYIQLPNMKKSLQAKSPNQSA